MKLITQELKECFAQVGQQREKKDPIVVAKFFDPTGSKTKYATEYEPCKAQNPKSLLVNQKGNNWKKKI